MSVEVHYATHKRTSFRGRDKSPGEIQALFNYMFFAGGYVLLDRHDNPSCLHCSEVVLGKVVCW